MKFNYKMYFDKFACYELISIPKHIYDIYTILLGKYYYAMRNYIGN